MTKHQSSDLVGTIVLAGPAANITPESRQILSFLNLPAGWHYGQGGPIALAMAGDAMQIAGQLRDFGFERFEAFPEVGGGVLLSAFHGEYSFEVLVKGEGLYDWTIEDAESLDEIRSSEGVDAENVLGEAWRIAHQKLSMSASSTRVITAKRRSGLRAWPSVTSKTEYHSLTQSAVVTPRGGYARISPSSIQIYPESLPYTGASRSVNFQQV